MQDVVALSPKYMGRAAAEETINDPTNPRHYWRYRIHYTVEDLLEDEPLLADLQALLLGASLAFLLRDLTFNLSKACPCACLATSCCYSGIPACSCQKEVQQAPLACSLLNTRFSSQHYCCAHYEHTQEQ